MQSVSALRNWIGVLALTILAACTVPNDLPPAPAEPDASEPFYVTPSYRIRVADQLSIRLVLNPELNEEVTVRPDGHISTTIAPDMRAANRTVPELVDALTEVYSQDLRAPRISVIVKASAPTDVFVTGEVTTPGVFSTLGTAPTLSQAIARAGGIKMSGDDAKIFIIRRRANDTPEFLSTRYSDIRHARDASADVRLAPFDVVYVPKTGIAEVYEWYNQYIQQFINPAINFTYFLNPSAAAASTVTQGAR